MPVLDQTEGRRSVQRAPNASQTLSVAYYAGLLNTASLAGFRRLIYRMSRGRVFVQAMSLGAVFNPADILTEDMKMNEEDEFFKDVRAAHPDR